MAPVGRGQLVAVSALCLLPGAAAIRTQVAPGLKCLAPESGRGHLTQLNAEQKPFDPPRECGSWKKQVRRLTSTAELPLSRDVWFGGLEHKFPLSLDSLGYASAPVKHLGARHRLRKASLRLVRREPLTISVLGGSMPFGMMSAAPYSQFLQEHFATLGFNVTVHNLAERSTTSEFPIEHIIPFRPELNESDVVVVDYTINDHEAWETKKDVEGKGSRERYSLLVQTLLQLPKRPAVVEFVSRSSRFGGGGSVCRGCTQDMSDFFHSTGIQKFRLPVISFPDAMCHASMPFWFYSTKETSWVHPNATTHDLIARLFLGIFALEGEAACTGVLGPDHPWFPLEMEEHTRCLSASPLMSMDFGVCRESATTAVKVPQSKCKNSSAAHDAGWSFARDKPTKPMGWLADPAAPSGSQIVFPLEVSAGGWIRLDFLATYENIGSIRCWLPGMAPVAGCLVDARIPTGISTEMSFYLGAAGLRAGRVDLLCRTVGGKFKLLGLASC